MKLLQTLSSPSREFTAIPFWFLNDELKDEEIQRQLRDFHDHGIYGVVLHPRMGIPDSIPYLSERFFHLIRTAVETAAQLDMTIVLYDEGMYPSGSANGQVVAGHPELASQGLALVKHPLPEDIILAQTPDGTLVTRPSGGTIRGIHFGEDDGEPNAPKSADLLNPIAVDRFIALTHEQYYAHLKEYFGNTILGFFTDEPSILGRNVHGMFPWTRDFDVEFTAAGGNLADLAALFAHEENDSTRLYHQMILQKESDIYYQKLSRWCEAHGIALMGHPHQSDDIEVQRWFHIPGQDLVLRWIAPEKDALSGIDSTMAHCSADAALLMGRRRNANECFGACNKNNNPWQLSGGDIKWYIDWLGVRGVNMFIPHAFYYSIAGSRKDERPPDVGPNSHWWPRYRLWSGYMQRLSALMTDIVPLDQVAVLCRNRDLVPEMVAPLQQHQIGYRYLPQSFWERCNISGGILHCAERQYSYIAGAADIFPEVPHLDTSALETANVSPDCICNPAQPDLRCAHFLREGTECWLLVNEGNGGIETEITFPTTQALGQYDLWNNKAQRLSANPGEKGMTTHLALPRRGSLLVFGCTGSQYQALPAPTASLSLEAPDFYLTKDDPQAIQKVYEAELDISGKQLSSPSVCITVQAEEMSQLFVNGKEAGVCFWSPCQFELQPLLKAGKNQLKLVVTGSLANRYGKAPVPYGLGLTE